MNRRHLLIAGAGGAAIGASASSILGYSLLRGRAQDVSDTGVLFRHRAALIARSEWWAWGAQYVEGETSASPIASLIDEDLGLGVEDIAGYRERVFTYFRTGVAPESFDWSAYKDLPWSAAFISYCMRLAGAGAQFPYAIGHHHYVTTAIRNVAEGAVANTIAAYPAADIAPRVGDLVWAGRRMSDDLDATGWTIDDIRRHLASGHIGYPSHCNIVVALDRKIGRLHSIGGNMADRVLRTVSQLDDQGRLQDSIYKIVIRNSIGEVAGI